MDRYAFIIGHSPALSLEELLTVLEPIASVEEVSQHFLICRGSLDPRSLMSRLGGTIKIVRVLHEFHSVQEITHDVWLKGLRPELATAPRRFDFGVSMYPPSSELSRHIKQVGIALKKQIRATGIPARFVMNNEGVLSSVAVKKNKLLNRELVIVKGKQYYVGFTVEVQDFDSYGFRDYGRPARDSERGMLPPKLAQIMLNLGGVRSTDTVLDPFCGVGTVLQEALLMGVQKVWGSDNDAQAITDASKNLRWLQDHYGVKGPEALLGADVFGLASHFADQQFSLVVTEPYLGPARLLKQKSYTRRAFDALQLELNRLYQHFFEELAALVPKGGRVVMVFPVFRLFGDSWNTGSLESIQRLGWRLERPKIAHRLSSVQLSSRGLLLYWREGQIVEREISVWERK